MEELFKRIAKCSKKDKAKGYGDYLLYATEELGEIATCIAVEEGLKNKQLKETKEEEACDAILCLIGLILRNPNWDYNRVAEQMSAKLPKWEARVLKGKK